MERRLCNYWLIWFANRLRSLASITVILFATSALSETNTAPVEHSRTCITEPVQWYFHPPETIARRFQIYRAMGIDTLRVGLEWRNAEHGPAGGWNIDAFRPYYQQVRTNQFKVKFIVGVLMGPPKWYFDAHPEARFRDQHGDTTPNALSYWYPGLKPLVSEKTEHLLDYVQQMGLAESLSGMVVDAGSAGEPLYPPTWTLDFPAREQTFWCYDSNAQENFQKTMRTRYGDIVQANQAWGTAYTNWSEVTVQLPGQRPGRYWQDVLFWYRDTKRDFIRWRVENLQASLSRRGWKHVRLLLYVPGTRYSQTDWEQAVQTGSGNENIRMMNDWEFLIQLAQTGVCDLQYTGAENETSVALLKADLQKANALTVPVWAENAGVASAAQHPGELVRIVRQYGLAGLDYTHANFAFDADTVSLNPAGMELEQALKQKTEKPAH